MIDISQASTITICDTATENTKAVFLGSFNKHKVRGGYDEKETIYNEIYIKTTGNYSKGKVEIQFIDYNNRKVLDGFFENLKQVNIIEEDGSVFNDCIILGKSLDWERDYDDDGELFWKVNFEVR